jgi:hypothetical protein
VLVLAPLAFGAYAYINKRPGQVRVQALAG